MNKFESLSSQTSYSNNALISLGCTERIKCAPNELFRSKEHHFYCLAFTQNGSALYRDKQRSMNLSSNSLLLFASSDVIGIRALETGWEAILFYFSGNALPYYHDAIAMSTDSPLYLSVNSPLEDSLLSLLQLKNSSSLAEELIINKHAISIFSEFLVNGSLTATISPKAPPYLLKIKEEFEQNYSKHFALDDLSAKYKISKYRLCREFERSFGFPPIKYLNKIRIQNACSLLLSTDMRINEISTSVGIESNNHFIRLFKTELSMTPLQYRQKMHL